MEMTKDYVKTTLREEELWKIGESDTFTHGKWDFTLRKESNDEYYKYSLVGVHSDVSPTGTHQTWSRRYKTMSDAFLHIFNNLNENANVKDKYNTIEEVLN